MTTAIAPRGNKRKREEENTPPPQIKLLKKEIGMAAPSSLAPSREFKKIAGSEHIIGCNRPFESDTLPLVLLHEAFGIFENRCETAPSERALTCLMELAPVACEWHDDGHKRWLEIQTVLEPGLGLRFHTEKIVDTELTTVGNLVVTIMPAAIRACKNDTRDSLDRVTLCYGHFLDKAMEHPLLFHNFDTRFPCILMVDMGMSTFVLAVHLFMNYADSFWGFYGAAWDGRRVRVEPLTPLFNLSTHWKERKARNAIASSLLGCICCSCREYRLGHTTS